MLKILPYIFLFSIGPSANAESVIRSYCSEARTLSTISTPADLEKTICHFQDQFPKNEKINFLSKRILEITSNLKSSGDKTWQDSFTLNYQLGLLNTELNSIEREKKSFSSNPIRTALKNLTEKWANIEQRTHNRNEYLKDFNEILRMTKTGKSVLDCYNKTTGPLISGEQVIDLSKQAENQGVIMAFSLEADGAAPGKFLKTVHFNMKLAPVMALYAYAHEMKHGCNSNSIAKFTKDFEEVAPKPYQPPPRTPESEEEKNKKEAFLEDLILKRDQDYAIDEMIAYKVNVELFKELAKHAPEYACDDYNVGTLFGTQIISNAEYNALVDDMINNGTFPLHMISRYAGSGSYTAENVLETKDGLTVLKLRSDLIKKIEAKGFHVKK
jgi:hypothetical protein